MIMAIIMTLCMFCRESLRALINEDGPNIIINVELLIVLNVN